MLGSAPRTIRIRCFLVALLAGGLAAALAGLLVGVPSLRLSGDYLAIVTLGFDEIIRVVIQNTEPLGAPRGLGGMPRPRTSFGRSRSRR